MPVFIEGLDVNFTKKAVQLFCSVLGIDNPCLHIFVDSTIKVTGACYQADKNDFMIVLQDQPCDGQMMVTLAHELVHVKQYLQNDLAAKFDATIPYMERWWEQEAYEKEVELTKLLIEAVENGEL
jgi:hypothetical protein